MILAPGDKVRVPDDPATTVEVAEAYYRGDQVEIVTRTGRTIWTDADRLTPAPAKARHR